MRAFAASGTRVRMQAFRIGSESRTAACFA